MGRVIEWALVALAFAAILTFAVYAGAAFFLWDLTPFSLRAARGVFLVVLVSSIAAMIDVERKEKKG